MIKCMYQYYSLGNADGTILISDLDQKDFIALLLMIVEVFTCLVFLNSTFFKKLKYSWFTIFTYTAKWVSYTHTCIYICVCKYTHTHTHTHTHRGFPGGSDGKASTCNGGDLYLIPGLGWSPGRRHGNPLQCSCWRIQQESPRTEELGRLQSTVSQTVGHDWEIKHRI